MASELTPRGRKIVLALHILSAGLWLGAAVAMVTIMWLRPAAPQVAEELLAWCLAVKLIDDAVVIGSAGGSLLTGLYLCWRTRWGFFVWYWVAFKLIATVLMVVFGATCLGPWIDRNAAIASRLGLHALNDRVFQTDETRVAIFGAIQATFLAVIVAVSVFKPWGRITYSAPEGASEKPRSF